MHYHVFMCFFSKFGGKACCNKRSAGDQLLFEKNSNAIHVLDSNLNGNSAMINRNKRERPMSYQPFFEMEILLQMQTLGWMREQQTEKIQRVREQRSVVTVR